MRREELRISKSSEYEHLQEAVCGLIQVCPEDGGGFTDDAGSTSINAATQMVVSPAEQMAGTSAQIARMAEAMKEKTSFFKI